MGSHTLSRSLRSRYAPAPGPATVAGMDQISEALATLRAGGIVGVPTDTVYGLAVDPYREESHEALFLLKDREAAKPLAILVASMEQAMSLAEFTDEALDLTDRHWPGGLTLVLSRLHDAPDWLGSRERRTIALRSPDHPIAHALLTEAGPLAVTSANREDEKPAIDAVGAAASFGDAVAYYLEGSAPGGEASTIVDLTEPTPIVLRPGPVSAP